ncbi:MAG: gamma-glutamylcyclotransferase family protein [Planctomycetota bacterium]
MMHEIDVHEVDVTAVFVYGTLKRGQCRHGLWPVSASEVLVASVRGELWGRDDYPALKRGEFRVIGELHTFESVQIPIVLKVLDQIEGTNGNSPADLYHRHVVDTELIESNTVLRAYAYFYVGSPERDGFHRVRVTGGQSSIEQQSWPEI